MPLLDVSSILLDPDLADTITVLRRIEWVGTNGRSTTSVQKIGTIGVVTMASPNDLDRAAETQVTTRTISVVTKFKARGEAQGYQPDIILWRGDNYVVKSIEPYPQFGAGFVQLQCDSMDIQDVAFDYFKPPMMAFNQTFNSGQVPICCL